MVKILNSKGNPLSSFKKGTKITVYNKMEADYFINRGKEIARMNNEPDRKYKTKAFFKCTMCQYREICWGENGAK